MDENFLHIDSVLTGIKTAQMKQLLQIVARQAAQDTGLPEKYIFDRLADQERRATSGIGGGVAIPHLRLGRLERPYALFAQLDHAVDAQALDNQPVGLVFLLLSPAKDVAGHLRRLSRISRLARQDELRARLRDAQSRDACLVLLQGEAQRTTAAA